MVAERCASPAEKSRGINFSDYPAEVAEMIRVADKLYYPSVLQRCQVKVLPGKDRNGTMTPDGGRRRIRENRLLLAVRGRPLKKKYHHGRIDSDLADKPLHSGGIRKPLDGKSAIHMASAWATDIRLVLGQLKTGQVQ